MSLDIGSVDVTTFPVEDKRNLFAILFKHEAYRKYAADILLGQQAEGALLLIGLAHYVCIIDVITLRQYIVDLRIAGVTIFPDTYDVDVVDHMTDIEDLQAACQVLFDADYAAKKAIYGL